MRRSRAAARSSRCAAPRMKPSTTASSAATVARSSSTLPRSRPRPAAMSDSERSREQQQPDHAQLPERLEPERVRVPNEPVERAVLRPPGLERARAVARQRVLASTDPPPRSRTASARSHRRSTGGRRPAAAPGASWTGGSRLECAHALGGVGRDHARHDDHRQQRPHDPRNAACGARRRASASA